MLASLCKSYFMLKCTAEAREIQLSRDEGTSKIRLFIQCDKVVFLYSAPQALEKLRYEDTKWDLWQKMFRNGSDKLSAPQAPKNWVF